MKKITTIILCLIFAINLMAQKVKSYEGVELQRYLSSAQARKTINSGWWLFGVGSAIFVSDIILIGCYLANNPDYPSNPEEDSKLKFYSVTMVAGAVTGISGIIVICIGSFEKGKIELDLKKFDTRINNSTAYGLGITFRF